LINKTRSCPAKEKKKTCVSRRGHWARASGFSNIEKIKKKNKGKEGLIVVKNERGGKVAKVPPYLQKQKRERDWEGKGGEKFPHFREQRGERGGDGGGANGSLNPVPRGGKALYR